MHPLAARLEPASFDDLAAVAELVRAVDIAETGESDTSAEEIGHDWKSDSIDLARDVRLVRGDDGAVIASAEVSPRSEGEEYDGILDVHPEHAEGPWFEVLIAWVRARATERAAGRRASLGVYCTRGNSFKAAALEAAGFTCDRVILRLSIELSESIASPPPLAAGVTVSEFRPGTDDEALHEVIEESFRDHYRSHPKTLATWRAEVVGDPQFKPRFFLLAKDGDQVLGGLEGFDRGDLGWVSRLGVRASARGRGVARALLMESFARMHDSGLRRVELGVDAENASGATRLYESVGMRTVLHYELWRTAVGGA